MTEIVEEQIPYTHRFVATADSRSRLARAAVGQLNRSIRTWVFYSVAMVGFVVVTFSGMDPRFSVGVRILWSFIYGLVPMLFVVVVVMGVYYARCLRASQGRLSEGAVTETGFGDDAFVFRNPLESGRISFRSIRTVKRRRDVVFVHRQGMPVPSVWPGDLFPDNEVERIRRLRG